MELVGQILSGISGLGSLVCFILVIVKMFQSGSTGLAIVCLVCCGVGGLVAFIYGWMKSKEWNITNIMVIWSVCIVIGIIGNVLAPSSFSQLQGMR